MADASWYPDPQNPAQLRYFDGLQWTSHVSASAPPIQPVAQHTTNVTMMQVGSAGPQKSVGLAVFLAFMFGPFGTLYGSVVGGVVLLASSVLIGWLLIPIPFIWIGSILWGALGASQYNSRFGGAAMSVTSQSPGVMAPAPIVPTAIPAPPQALAPPLQQTQAYGQTAAYQPAATPGSSPWAPHSGGEDVVEAEVLAVESAPDQAPTEGGWWAG